MPKPTPELGDNLTPKTVGMPHLTTIHIEENEDIPPTGLFIGHNGRSFMIKAGYDVDVPEELLEVLDNAVGKVAVLDPVTKKVVSYRDKLRFPYRIVTRKGKRREPAMAD